MRSALLVSSLLLISGSLSAATVLDFETYDTVDTINPFTGEPAGCLSGSEPLCIGGDILHKGYAVNWGQASWYQVSDLRLAPCIVYDVCDPLYEGGWNLTQASAQAFNVLSIDVSVNWDDPAYNDSYTGETYPNAFADF